MKKLYLLTTLLAMLFVQLAFAQGRTVTGTVTDADNGEPLVGVNVLVAGTVKGTVTDFDGKYSLTLPEGYKALVFTFVGYENQEVILDGASNIVDISMSPGVALDEVVVTAFGISREKKALSYSVQEVQGDVVSKAVTPNVTNALQGKIAGVQVNQSSGMPGASAFIRVRGSNSLDSNNEPLYVVDGIPISSGATGIGGEAGTGAGFTDGVDYTSRSLDIDPNDIESVSVLKGASAAALYGLRASNGVVLITTKSGRANTGRTQVNLTQRFTIDKVSLIPETQEIYGQGNSGFHSPGTSMSWGPRITDMGDPAVNPSALGDGSGNYINNVGREVSPQAYDNVSPIFDNGFTSTTALDINGGTDKGNYGFAIGYTGQQGIIEGTGMKRFNTKLSGEYQIAPKLTSGGTVNFVVTSVDKLAGGSNLSNVLFTTYWAPASYDLWGTPYNTDDNPYNQVHYRAAMDNPRWSLENNNFNENVKRSFGSIFLEYKPLDWLRIKYRIGGDVFAETRKEVYGLGSGKTGGRGDWEVDPEGNIITSVGGDPTGGRISDIFVNNQEINSNFMIMVNKDLTDDLNLDLIVGNEVYDERTRFGIMTGSDIQIGGFDNIGNTAAQTVEEGQLNRRTIGFYGNANLGFRRMLFLNASLRQDIVSNLPDGNRSFLYPSVGLGFVFTEALGLSENQWINFGKIRGSYAQVGQAPDYIYNQTNTFTNVGGATNVGTGFTTDGIDFPFGGNAGYRESNTIISPDLRPQNTGSWEVGLELQTFRNRLGFDVAYYHDKTLDQIFLVPIASSTGYAQELRNAGELVSKGWELSVTGVPVRLSNGFNWNVLFNFTKVNNEVVSLAEGVENIFLGGFVEPNVRAQAGDQYPIIFGSRYLRDDDGNIVYDSRATINGQANPAYGMPLKDDDNGAIGNVNPDFEAGLSNTLSFKGVSLSVHWDFRKGGNMYAGNTRLQKLYGKDIITEDRESAYVMEGKKGYVDGDGNLVIEGDNDIAIQRGQEYWRTYMDAIDESSVYETSFVRFRELNIGYTLPSKLLKNTKIIRGASLTFDARNLLLFTSYPNFDPETSVGGATNFQGMEYVNLPQARSFGFTAKLSF